MTVGILSGVAATPRIAVTDEKVWLTDPSLSAVADPTGAAYSTDAFQAAMDRASSGPEYAGQRVISGPPGEYELGHLFVPRGVGFASETQNGGMRLSFPDDTGEPTLASAAVTALAGATSLQYSNLKGSGFLAASPGSPQKVLAGHMILTYTGVTVSTGTTGTLTGVSGLTTDFTGVATDPDYPGSISQGYAMAFAGSGYDYTVLGPGIVLVGPSVGTRAAWSVPTPPDSLDAVFLGNFARIDCPVSGFRHAASFTGDHQRFGKNFAVADSYSAIHAAEPAQSRGNQKVEGGARLDGQFWAGIYLSSGNFLNVADFGAQVVFGNEPWAVWKAGNPPTQFGMFADVTLHQPTHEGMGSGLYGSEDGQGLMSNVDFFGSNAGFNPTWLPPSESDPTALFNCRLSNVKILGSQTLFSLGTPANAQAAFLSDDLAHCVFEGFAVVAQGSLPICAPVDAASTQVHNVRWEGDRWRGRLFPTIGAIIQGDLAGYRGAAAPAVPVQTAQFAQQQIAGVALEDSQNSVVALVRDGWIEANVAPGAPGASVSAAAGAGPVRLNNSAAGKVTEASSWGDTNGHVFGSAMLVDDDGSKVPIHLNLPI